MTAPERRLSFTRTCNSQNSTILIGVICIFLGIFSLFFLFSDSFPLYYRKCHFMNGAFLAVLGVQVICGVLRQSPQSLLLFIIYQCITLFLSSLAIVFALIDDEDLRTFIVSFYQGRHDVEKLKGIEPHLVPAALVYLIVVFYVLPLIFLTVVLRCFVVMKNRASNEGIQYD